MLMENTVKCNPKTAAESGYGVHDAESSQLSGSKDWN